MLPMGAVVEEFNHPQKLVHRKVIRVSDHGGSAVVRLCVSQNSPPANKGSVSLCNGITRGLDTSATKNKGYTPPFFRRLFFSKGRKKAEVTSLSAGGTPGVNAASPDEQKVYLQGEEHVHEQLAQYIEVGWNELVSLPDGIERNEWLATNTTSFFEHTSLLYDTISEYCTPLTCSAMVGPGNMQYQWIDDKGKKYKCAAPQYIDFVMSYVQKTVSEESTFPTKYGNLFPTTFESTVKKIHRLLFHVFAHVYQCHFKEIVFLRLQPHLNSHFIHFMTFSRKFGLLEDKDTDCLDDLLQKLESHRNLRIMEVNRSVHR